VTVVDKSTGLPVPHAIEVADRIPSRRYFDPAFYDREADLLWSRTWQMACRLEEIPEPGDVVEYEILDQSVMVLRTEDGGVRAFQNACRHRGVKLVDGRDRCESGFTCPFHGWCYGTDGKNTSITRRRTFAEHNLEPGDTDLRPVRCETWGGCAWINLDDDAPPLRESIEPAASILDAWDVESLRAEWWFACRLPVNWKLAQEAFVEQYHVLETHPQLRIPGRMPVPGEDFDPRTWIDSELHYLRMMSQGMDGMVHAKDVRIAEALAETIELPADPALAMATWHRTYNDAVTREHRAAGHVLPDLNELEAAGMNEPMGYVFPHYFVLPMYSSASSYRFRALGPEETLMEIWSMTRYPEGDEPPTPQPPEVWAHDDPRWPPIPAQDFSNLPRQQRGLHAKGFEYMRLSEKAEGHISNFHRVIDRYLAGLPHEEIAPALRHVNVNPLEMPIVDLDG
jgi:nitrite reductase/ring-hydroxylating ferredoxin subunit